MPHELAIIRYDYRSVEYVRGLSKRQIIGYLVEVPMVFSFLHSDGRKQESFPCHLQTQSSHVPMAWDNFCLPDLKVASLVQVSQQAESEFHGLCEMTIKRSQSLLFAVDQHLAFHAPEKEELRYNLATVLLQAGRDEESLPVFRQVFREHSIWVEITKRNVMSGDLPNDPPRIQRVLDQAVVGDRK